MTSAAPPVTATQSTSQRTAAAWARALVVVQADVRQARASKLWSDATGGQLKRLLLALKTRHSLFAGLIARGVGTLNRAQTIQVFINSIALELVIVSMLYAPRAPGDPLVINPLKVAVTGSLASLIAIPCVFVFGWAFFPCALVRVLFALAKFTLRLLLCFPCLLGRCLLRRHQRRRSKREARRQSLTSKALQGEGRVSTTGNPSSHCAPPAARLACQPRPPDSKESKERAATAAEATAAAAGETGAEEAVAETAGAAPAKTSSCPPPASPTSRGDAGKRARVACDAGSKPAAPPPASAASHVAARPRRSTRMAALGISRRDLDMLRGAAPRMAAHAQEDDDEMQPSASRSHRRRLGLRGQKSSVRLYRRGQLPLLIGWCLNWLLLLVLLELFLLYSCELATRSDEQDAALLQRELLFAWLWSVLQRILFNEPLVILLVRCLPLLMHSRLCSGLCSEGCVEYVAMAMETAALALKELAS